jgi:adenine-specific DNA-methyltransferase
MPSPRLSPQTTTLWEYPSQHYGNSEQGSSDYKGATPSWVIWNLLQRYTEPGQVVLDPMCGSGTTYDVATDLDRNCVAFDLQSTREEIEEADARDLPLGEDVIDFVFMDPPYGKNLKYSGKPACIGELDAREQEYFDSMKVVFEEAWRVLKPGGHLAVYVCDVWTRSMFVPIGMHYLFMLSQIFEVVDHIAVVRHNKDLDKGNYHKAAEETNFYLRGFNHLLIMRKLEQDPDAPKAKKKRRAQPSSGGRGKQSQGQAGSGKRPGGSRSRKRGGRASDMI